MAQFTINIATEEIQRIIDAAVNNYNYNEDKLEGETQSQFALRIAKVEAIQSIKRMVKKYEDRINQSVDIEIT